MPPFLSGTVRDEAMSDTKPTKIMHPNQRHSYQASHFWCKSWVKVSSFVRQHGKTNLWYFFNWSICGWYCSESTIVRHYQRYCTYIT